MFRRMFKFTILLSFLVLMCSVVSAENNEWRDPAFNFSKVKTILVLQPQFSYSSIDADSKDKFNKYPDANDKVIHLLEDRMRGKNQFKPVSVSYVEGQIKGDPELPLIDKVSSDLFTQELPKHVDLVLVLEVHDFGWYYKYQEAYDSTETKTETVRYGGVTPDGKEYSGWMEVPRTITVHHPPSYGIYDTAALKIYLKNPATQKVVWTYTDSRSRESYSWSREYDETGPESMMNRIFDEAFKKIPLS